MKAQVKLEDGVMIIKAWGIGITDESAIECPDDYSPSTYDFVNGEFIPKEPPQETNKLEKLVNAGFSIEQAQIILSITN